ncbi:MAG: HupE/UreJ family protein [Alteraurantiacibacter sp.]
MALLSLAFAMPALADEARPLYIEAAASGATTIDLAWRIPPTFTAGAIPDLILPPDCAPTAPMRQWSDGVGHQRAERWICRQPLAGRAIRIAYPMGNPNLPTIYRAVLADGTATVGMRLPGVTHIPFPAPTAQAQGTFGQYLVMGVEHIWLGFDHLLFVACLVWIAGRWRRVVTTVTGFTIGHSVTLAAAALNLVTVPVRTIEVLIALSIVLLAVELARGRSDTVTWRHPLAVSTGFGLLHGFGFAAVLKEVGLPQAGLLSALLAFNLGIELGQLVFVAALLAAGALLGLAARRLMPLFDQGRHASLPRLASAYFIGITATYWMLQRAV